VRMVAERTRRDSALVLADELLADIELGNVDPVAVARKAGRLARLLDDADAVAWLAYETSGYPSGTLDPVSWRAAERSGRTEENEKGEPRAQTVSLGRLSSEIEASLATLGSQSGGTSSSEYAVIVERENAKRAQNLRVYVATRRDLLDRIVGSVHGYVSDRHRELRFGSAVESAFGVVRQEVDSAISELVPSALPMITAAFENASSDNPEHWQNAASTCRRLLMTAADQLQPPGPDIDGHKMGPGNYVNGCV
jgi:hypothetical protein